MIWGFALSAATRLSNRLFPRAQRQNAISATSPSAACQPPKRARVQPPALVRANRRPPRARAQRNPAALSVRAQRRTPRARARAKESSRPLGARAAPHASRPSAREEVQSPSLCARSAARLAPERARRSPVACPDAKRARSLGRPDHDQRLRAAAQEPAEPGGLLFFPSNGSPSLNRRSYAESFTLRALRRAPRAEPANPQPLRRNSQS